MKYAKAILKGPTVGRKSGVFKASDGKEEPYGIVQMEMLDKEAVKIYEITLAPGFDINRYPVGSMLEIEVTIGASKDGKRLYFRQVPGDDTAKTPGTRADDL